MNKLSMFEVVEEIERLLKEHVYDASKEDQIHVLIGLNLFVENLNQIIDPLEIDWD